MKRIAGYSALRRLRCWWLSPVLLVPLGLAVKFGSKGTDVLQGARIGRKGRTFDLLQVPDHGAENADHLKADLEHMNEREGVLFKIVNDPRVTKIGRRCCGSTRWMNCRSL